MPKLLQINATANWGSTGRIAEQIGLAAMDAGWESYIAYGRDCNPSESQLIKVGSRFGIYMHVLKARFFDKAGLGSFVATKRLIRTIEKIKPDIIHLHNIHGYYINYNLLFQYLGKANVDVVWTFHDCWAFTGHCSHFVTAKCDRWMTQCYDCPLMKQYPRSVLIDRSRENYLQKKALFSSINLTVISVSDWMKSLVEKSFLNKASLKVIQNGVDLTVFKPVSVPDRGAFRVLAVSNVWNKDKGLNDLIALRNYLDDRFAICVVGLTPEQIKQLPEGIEGMTRTSSVEELVEVYSSADVLVNPTYADTFPTVNLEALACGTPVITYQTGGSPEAVDENTGVVVPQGDVKALADAVMRMKDTPLSRNACRARAEEHFDKDKCFRKYIELYEELLNIHKM